MNTTIRQRVQIRRHVFTTAYRPEPRPGEAPRGALLAEPGSVLLVALWFGVITGLLELLQLSVRNQLSGSVWLGILRMNRHFGWMIPTANALIFLVTGVATALIVKLAPKLRPWLAVRVPGFLAAMALLLTIRGLHLIASLAVAVAVSHLLARLATVHDRAALRMIRRSLPVLLLLEISLAGACTVPLMAREQENEDSTVAMPGEPTPNVLLIVLDTVRAESLSLYGYGRETTPNLARLARRGVRFEQARSTAPWTFPSHASMFTGRWPHELNVGENHPLDGTYPTLAEYLAAHGYRTGGFVANTFFCNSWYGLARGFDRYEDFYDDDLAVSWTETFRCAALGQRLLTVLGVSAADHRIRKDAARINRDFLEWLSEEEGQPFFAFLNYFDAHSPYVLPEAEQRRLGTPEPTADELGVLRTWDDRPKQQISATYTQLIRDAYDECLASLDHQLGRLFDELERRGSLKNTLVILTSDHGEELGEHGLYGHGKSLYGQEIHVPLLILPHGERVSRNVIPGPVSLRDIPATVLDVLKTRGTAPFPGASLASHWRSTQAGEPVKTSPAFSEVSLRMGVSHNPNRPPAWRGPMQALALGNRAYVHNADGTEQLFDLLADLQEERNLVGLLEERVVLEQFRRLLRSVQVLGSVVD